MSLLLLFGQSQSTTIAGSTVNVTVAAPTGSLSVGVSLAGAVVNIAIAAPVGFIGPSHFPIRQPGAAVLTGSASSARTGAPAGVVLIATPRSVILSGPFAVFLTPTPDGESF